MKSRLVPLVPAFAVSLALAPAATPTFAQSSATGLSGLGEMRSPDITTDPLLSVVPGRYSFVREEIGQRVVPSIAYTHSFLESIEAAVFLPYVVHGRDDRGLGNATVSGKYRLLDTRFFQGAVTAGLELPTGSKEREFGSGEVGGSAGILASSGIGPLRLLGSLEYGTTDYCERCTYPGAQLDDPRSVPTVRGAAGMSVLTSDGFGAFAELHAAKANNGVDAGAFDGDPDLYGVIGGRVPLPSGFGLTTWWGTGLDAAANTQFIGAMMLNYSFGGAPLRAERRFVPAVRRKAMIAIAPSQPVEIESAPAISAPRPLVAAEAPAVPVPLVAPPPVVVALAPAPVPTPFVVVPRAVPAATPPGPRVTITDHRLELPESIHFLTGKAIIDAESYPLLDSIARALNDHPEIALVRIEGHTDITGSVATNLRLSTARAVAVRDQLIDRGVAAGRLEAIGLGSTKPVAPNDTSDGRLMNRRVELIIVTRR